MMPMPPRPPMGASSEEWEPAVARWAIRPYIESTWDTKRFSLGVSLWLSWTEPDIHLAIGFWCIGLERRRVDEG